MLVSPDTTDGLTASHCSRRAWCTCSTSPRMPHHTDRPETKTIFDLLGDLRVRVEPVGRLDMDTEELFC